MLRDNLFACVCDVPREAPLILLVGILSFKLESTHLLIITLFAYSEVPNKRPDWNIQVCWIFFENLVLILE